MKASSEARAPARPTADARIALVHDWLTGYRGGEKVLEAMAEVVGGGDVHTLFHVPGANPPLIEDNPIHASWMNRIPGVHDRYRWLLPLFPGWADRLDLSDYDLVLSSSHCVAKGARPAPGAIHVCYCHTPMRYVWDRFDDYFGHWTGLKRRVVEGQARRLRRWDRETAGRVHRWLANSRFVRRRILDFYGTDPERVAVVPPPVEIERFGRATSPRGERYLVVSALVPYKRIDVAVEACARSGRPLDVAGRGPELDRLRRLAARRKGSDVRFLGFVADEELPELMASHRALLFPGIEDFGITPVEAMAAGLPVIARGEGGALDTVEPGVSGLLYEGEGVDGLIGAMEEFETSSFEAEPMRRWVEQFSRENFARRYREELDRAHEIEGMDSRAWR